MITEWTSEEMNWDDPSIEEAKYIEAIIMAINERCEHVFKHYEAYGWGRYPNDVGAPPISTVVTGNKWYQSKSLMSSIYSTLIQLAKVYISLNPNGNPDMLRIRTYVLRGTVVSGNCTNIDYGYVGWQSTTRYIEADLPFAGGDVTFTVPGRVQVSDYVTSVVWADSLLTYKTCNGYSYPLIVPPTMTFKTWQETELLTYVGATDIVPDDPKDWLKQMYKMVNALKILNNSIVVESSITEAVDKTDYGSNGGGGYRGYGFALNSLQHQKWWQSPVNATDEVLLWGSKITYTLSAEGWGFFKDESTVFTVHREDYVMALAHAAFDNSNQDVAAEYWTAGGLPGLDEPIILEAVLAPREVKEFVFDVGLPPAGSIQTLRTYSATSYITAKGCTIVKNPKLNQQGQIVPSWVSASVGIVPEFNFHD